MNNEWIESRVVLSDVICKRDGKVVAIISADYFDYTKGKDALTMVVKKGNSVQAKYIIELSIDCYTIATIQCDEYF